VGRARRVPGLSARARRNIRLGWKVPEPEGRVFAGMKQAARWAA